MGARTDQQCLDRLAETRPRVGLNGECIDGPVAEHPVLTGTAGTYVCLCDLQHASRLQNVVTDKSPTSGGRLGRSLRVAAENYVPSAGLSRPERIGVLHPACAVSALAFRHNLSYYLFLGDRVRMAGSAGKATDRELDEARVRAMRQRGADEHAQPARLSEVTS